MECKNGEHDKRVRAEVLAACIDKSISLQQKIRELAEAKLVTLHRRAQLWCALNYLGALEDLIRQVEPAAEALGELLREARLKELKDWPELCNIIHCNHGHNCMYHSRIAELEKARSTNRGKGG